MNTLFKITLLLILFPFTLFSQQFYYSDIAGDIHLFNAENCQDDLVIDIQTPGFTFQDITFAPDGNLYGVRGGELYLINMTTGVTTLIFDWCPVGFCNTSSLVSDNDGNIFTAGSNLYSYNIYTGNSINHGALPTNMNSAGDMTYYNGTLYLAGINNNIIQVNITDPMNSQVLFDFNTASPIVGISTFFISCDSVISFGSTQLGEFYLIDIENGIVSPFPCNANGNIVYGLASPQEYLASNCNYTLDLDGDDSSGGVNGNFQYGTCALPSPVVDTDVVLLSGYLIDSIVIQNAPNFVFPFEYCSVEDYPGMYYYVNLTGNLVIANLGNATGSDFKAVLSTVLYHNDSPNPDYGSTRDIQITVWSASAGEQLTSVFSVTYWPVPIFSLGPDTVNCPNNNIVLIPSPSNWPNGYFYEWQDASTASNFTVTAPGEYSLTISADFAVGCSASDTIQVTTGASISTQSSVQLCTGETFTLNGQTFTSDTTVCSTFSAFSGCDSTHCTTVVFTPLLQSTVAVGICQGSSFPFNGQMLTMAGTYLDTIANPNGCDTLIQLVLSVLPTSLTLLDSTVCQGDSVTVGGLFFSSPGLHTVMLPAANGCDSTVMLTLSVLQNTSANVSASICEGSSYTLGGMSFAASGDYQVTLPNWLGCDSTVNLSLTVLSAITINLDTAICEGQSLDFYGQNLSQSGNYEHTATSPAACDTVYNLALSVLALPTVAISQTPNGCAASSVLLSANSNTPANGLSWSNAANGPTTSVGASGQYSVTATDANGCSSTATTVVSLAPTLVASIETSSPICANGLGGWIEISGESGGVSPYSFAINGGPLTSSPIFEDLGTGSYEVVVMDNSGCVWDTAVNIAEPPVFQINAGPDQTIQIGTVANLNLNSSSPLDSIWWVPTDFLDCTTCQNPTSTPDNSIEYQVFAIDSNGCLATDIVSIIVLQPQGSDVYAPNAFSPNGDGLNDAFTLFGSEKIVAIESLTIFDRWGGMVFYVEGIAPNDLSQGWTGEWRGKQANQGVYTWMAMIKLADGTNKLLAGDVTLLR